MSFHFSIRFRLISFLLLFTIHSFSQNVGTIQGVVTDANSGEALAFSNVLLIGKDIGASTNDRGIFVITGLKVRKVYKLKASYIGYEDQIISVYVKGGGITQVKFSLKPISLELQTVEKIGHRIAKSNATDVSLQRISITELKSLPRGVEPDVFRSIQYMSGVRSMGDASARYYVRGGASNQNLVTLDGVDIYNPYHAMGIFSSINPDIINNVEFYKGGFTAEYSGRISSVLKVITNDGNKNKISAGASLSYLAGKAIVEGPIGIGSFYLAGRKSYSSKILDKFLNDKSAPVNFYDLNFKISFLPKYLFEKSKFTVEAFLSKDNITNKKSTLEDYQWKSNFYSINWFQFTDSPLFFNVNFSSSNFVGELLPNYSGLDYKKTSISDFTIKTDLTYVYPSKDELGIGIHIKEVHSSLKVGNDKKRYIDLSPYGTNISVYAKYKFLRYKNLGIDAGTILNLTRLAVGTAGIKLFEPRLSMTYRVNESLAFKAAWGVYNQELTTVTDEDDIFAVFEPWIIIPKYLDPTQAIHYIAGLDFSYNQIFSAQIEGYYKKINNIALLNENKFLPSEPDLINANGEAYGLDANVNLNFGDVVFTANYSLGWVYQTVYNFRYPPKYDSRHVLNLSADWNLGAGWKLSAVWVYNTGHPFTQATGFYHKWNPLSGYVDSIFKDYFIISILSTRNGHRLPDYHRLDLSLSKKIKLPFALVTLNFSVLNAYDRANLFYFNRKTGQRVNMLPILPTATVRVEI